MHPATCSRNTCKQVQDILAHMLMWTGWLTLAIVESLIVMEPVYKLASDSHSAATAASNPLKRRRARSAIIYLYEKQTGTFARARLRAAHIRGILQRRCRYLYPGFIRGAGTGALLFSLSLFWCLFVRFAPVGSFCVVFLVCSCRA
jgi:hypothetical protein